MERMTKIGMYGVALIMLAACGKGIPGYEHSLRQQSFLINLRRQRMREIRLLQFLYQVH